MLAFRYGYLSVLLSSVCFGFLGYFGKIAYSLGFTPLQLMTVRFILAALLMWPLALVRDRQAYRLSQTETMWLVVQGVAYAFTALGFFYALSYLPAGLAAVLFFVHPLLTMVMSRILWQEAVGGRLAAAAALSFAGVALVSQSPAGGAQGDWLLGLLWIGLAAASYSCFTLLGRKTTRTHDSIAVTTYAITFCALFLILLNPPVYLVDGSMSSGMWLVAFGLSFIATVMAILLYVVGIKSIGASVTAVLSAFEPLSGLVVAFLLLGERLSLTQTAGITLIIFAVLMITWRGGRKTAPGAGATGPHVEGVDINARR